MYGQNTAKLTIIFLLPAILLVGFVLIYPTLFAILGSFFQWNHLTMGRFAGFENYVSIFRDSDFLHVKNITRFIIHPPPYGALVHSIIWSSLFVPTTMLFGLIFAVLTRKLREGSILKSLVLLSYAVPMIVGGIIVFFTLDKDAGFFNGLLKLIGLGKYARSWIIYPETALLFLIFGSIWIYTGLAMLIYAAGLEALPEEIEEAAKIDGASPWKIFWHITFPQLRPSHSTASVMLLIWSFKVFDLIYASTGGGPGQSSTVLGMLLYSKTFYAFKVGEGLVISNIITLIAVTISALFFRRRRTA